ncbi:uncharacterized protein LOC117124302 [Anneissia japonica]|uniref:uncharacterized protein LOC117124302 n=1 Tax=Anneissia japonica TaxID=1529436 RepID=UPI00142590EC|nr:uncharacterized protein LOC117124302 [Anneissia japonica]XP_033126379.1 uncharacterized protein LOC117124302 [Anneissia japonica]XP_033126380.1 uncharacterized protein LOC117124302 [Anneissia japonica]XP_033126381.1 uncharacterized protein LOC117124302 [Anneissia japonica]
MSGQNDKRDRLRSRSVGLPWILDKQGYLSSQTRYMSNMLNRKDRLVNEEHKNLRRAISRFQDNPSWTSRQRIATSPARIRCTNINLDRRDGELSLLPQPITLQGHGLFEKIHGNTPDTLVVSKHFNKPVKKLPFQSLVEHMDHVRKFDQQLTFQNTGDRKAPLSSPAFGRCCKLSQRKQNMFRQTNQISRNYQKTTHQSEDEPAYFVLPKCRGLTTNFNRLPSIEFLYNKERCFKLNVPTPTPQISRQSSCESLPDLIVNVDKCVLANPTISTFRPKSVPLRKSLSNLKCLPEIVITHAENGDFECIETTCQQWKLHKLVRQCELRRRELLRLTEDIKEFNDLNKTLKENLATF